MEFAWRLFGVFTADVSDRLRHKSCRLIACRKEFSVAKFEPNSIIGILRGKLAGLIFSRKRDGTFYVRRRPVRKAPPTAAELRNQNAFKRALAYVAMISRSPAQYARYELAAKIAGKRARDLANADYRRPPVIGDVDVTGYTGRAGEQIHVAVTDDFAVASVFVDITEVNGIPLEQGAAVPEDATARWRYSTQATAAPGHCLSIQITASDTAGNTVKKWIHHAPVAP
jgi:hypothetical protein